ncbi:MAG TPA: Hsp20/alpha crystallin family protein [Gemmatimonadales bacterium]|nr:Hsp20/alpha crystallin family protein [Gemmatimonadales bacterium]
MFGITRKFPGDPWAELLYNLERRMGRAFNEPLTPFNWQFSDVATAAWTPVVDIFEETGYLRIVAEIPGVSPAAVKILVENNVLTIQGTKEQLAEEKAEKVHRYERAYGAFERSFTLPATVDATTIKATYEMGLLTLILPKVEKAKPREIKLEIVPEKKLKA